MLLANKKSNYLRLLLIRQVSLVLYKRFKSVLKVFEPRGMGVNNKKQQV